jgi:hypothetical protein
MHLLLSPASCSLSRGAGERTYADPGFSETYRPG